MWLTCIGSNLLFQLFGLWSFPPWLPTPMRISFSGFLPTHKLRNTPSLLYNSALSIPGQQTQSPLNRLRSRLQDWDLVNGNAPVGGGRGQVGGYCDPVSSFPWVSGQMRICPTCCNAGVVTVASVTCCALGNTGTVSPQEIV